MYIISIIELRNVIYVAIRHSETERFPMNFVDYKIGPYVMPQFMGFENTDVTLRERFDLSKAKPYPVLARRLYCTRGRS